MRRIFDARKRGPMVQETNEYPKPRSQTSSVGSRFSRLAMLAVLVPSQVSMRQPRKSMCTKIKSKDEIESFEAAVFDFHCNRHGEGIS